MLFLLTMLTSLFCCLFVLFHNKNYVWAYVERRLFTLLHVCDKLLERTLSYMLHVYDILRVSIDMTNVYVTLTPNSWQVLGYSHI